ncbi:hypothetical protein EFR56_00660, partial [Lactobacillus delbrueckii]|nr:hypothetical protein [Lactobacillus delbrueckii]
MSYVAFVFRIIHTLLIICYIFGQVNSLAAFAETKKIASDMTPEIRTLISGVIFMTKYTKEIKLAIYH